MPTGVLYLLMSREESDRFLAPATFVTTSLDKEGFIHASGSEAQTLRVANRKFRHVQDLVALEISRALVVAPIKDESGGEPELFPHIYGPLNTGACTARRPVLRDPSGAFVCFGPPLP
ncbi:MAG: DUF952 domain-containing protein [Dehalococcoidia bacterium]|nr:DUF952 domain-containing protein [Dehalococcoidia bacterium]